MPADAEGRVHCGSDRRPAVEHWLLSTLSTEERKQALTQWRDHSAALLPLGDLFSAVRIPRHLIEALARTAVPADLDEFLDQALDGGPVICDDRRGRRYYALVPATMPVTWHQAVDEWRSMDVDCLGRGTYLGVPRVEAVDPVSGGPGSYWSVPMSPTAALCSPLHVARLLAAARQELTAG
ncbi:hypothetical protein AB0M97_11325 [Streptomyces sp. NPDC051207]|uniref:hypothetical protein n=1 Tax=Streptomyces sp. NPDC051207 TaxID=3154641 RepID=UPI00342B06A2